VLERKAVEYKSHLGGNVYVGDSKQYLLVNICHFWKPKDSNDMQPTRKGVTIKVEQYEKLKDVVQVMPDFIPKLKHCLSFWMGSYFQNEL